MTEFNALLIGLSRGIDRFYLFTEDMRDQICVPRSGELHREGSALGVLNSVGPQTPPTPSGHPKPQNGTMVELCAAEHPRKTQHKTSTIAD